MRKILLVFVLALTLVFSISSCGDKVVTVPFENPLTVVKIESLNQSKFNSLCVYRIETGVDYLEYIDNYNVIDSIGKFRIGDEVHFQLVRNK